MGLIEKNKNYIDILKSSAIIKHIAIPSKSICFIQLHNWKVYKYKKARTYEKARSATKINSHIKKVRTSKKTAKHNTDLIKCN